MDHLTKAGRSALMCRIKSKDTGPERRLALALRNIGLGPFRMHDRALPGTPDFVFDWRAGPTNRPLVVEVLGCFFHGCPRHYKRPKTNKRFWDKKVRDNTARDLRNARRLGRRGVRSMRVWEHGLRTAAAADRAAGRVGRRLCGRR